MAPGTDNLYERREAAILVFVGGAVAITEEALEAVFAPQLADNLVQCLTVEGIVIDCKGRVADVVVFSRCMGGLTCERDSRGSKEDRVCLFLLWASRSTNITDHEQPCRAKHIGESITVTAVLPEQRDKRLDETLIPTQHGPVLRPVWPLTASLLDQYLMHQLRLKARGPQHYHCLQHSAFIHTWQESFPFGAKV
ncbi:hypothetical protein EYF80_021416 [Liparis tanakae]|uniref:Uncharacterized protein n=1 Tax=Liparis tanakae TaxID=230148 RepID=A0A4Z2HTT5_9TELE|nr:hypothetical protein EYF80_021416 [Liparis tanakae]